MIRLTPEEIEANRRFCEANKLIKKPKPKPVKKPRKKQKRAGWVTPKMIDYIIENYPCSPHEIAREFNTDYIYQKTCRTALLRCKRIDYCSKRKVWFVKGEKIEQFPRATKKDYLLSEIKRNGRITTAKAQSIVGDPARCYLHIFGKAGYITKVKQGVWEWVC